jgi:aryl-alcohol dehydrogenase-like predicted oxidoreductase
MADQKLNRRELCGLLGAAAFASGLPMTTARADVTMTTREVPSSGEALPVIGMGSSGTFNAGASALERGPLAEVLRVFSSSGGTIIDTSPMYGNSEAVLGDLIEQASLREKLWLATKVWIEGREAGEKQIAESMRLLHTDRLELLQIHNLLDWRAHVPTIRALQDSGKLRYSGLTHYKASAHADLERVLAVEKFDWVQFNYSLAEREAERRLLPFCEDKGIAVMINRPFADGAMFQRVRGKALPPWAVDIGCESWAQFFLRFVISHPAVTCSIPATSKPHHMEDNMRAGAAPLPDKAQRAQMAAYFATL